MEVSKEVTETRSNMEIAQSELELYLSRYNSVVARLSQAQEALESTSNTLRERKAAIKDIADKLPQAEQQLKEVRLDFPISFGVTPKPKSHSFGYNRGENKPRPISSKRTLKSSFLILTLLVEQIFDFKLTLLSQS